MVTWRPVLESVHRARSGQSVQAAPKSALPAWRGWPVTGLIGIAAAIATGDRDTLVRLAVTFAGLGCPYQQARTARMVAGPPAAASE
jgi:hypothetical protein